MSEEKKAQQEPEEKKDQQPEEKKAQQEPEEKKAAETPAQPANPPKKKKGKGWLIALIVVLGVGLLGGGGYFAYENFLKPKDAYDRFQFDTEAMEGRIQMMTEEEIQAELNRVIEEGMFNISIASAIVFDPTTGEGEARIENIPANRYHMQVEIYLDENNEKVYSSKLIQPGKYVEKIKLDRQLAPGMYSATAVFNAITKEELQLFGSAGAKVTLYIPDAQGNFHTPEPGEEGAVPPMEQQPTEVPTPVVTPVPTAPPEFEEDAQDMGASGTVQ